LHRRTCHTFPIWVRYAFNLAKNIEAEVTVYHVVDYDTLIRFGQKSTAPLRFSLLITSSWKGIKLPYLPFAERLPRALKREAGGTDASQVPANIRTAGIELDQDDRAYIRQTLGMKLGKYATSIERVSVRIKDVNGPRGGVDQVCRIKVVLSGLPSVVFQSQAASLKDAINGASPEWSEPYGAACSAGA
jgi:hypothetical protein